MNPVAPVNILLSTNLDNLERIAKTPSRGIGPLTEHIEELINPAGDSYLFSSKNTNFVSLTHELLDKDAFSINLLMQEPDNNILDNLLPKNVNEFMESGGERMRPTFYLMYGIGKSISHHWAGPFICDLIDFNYYQDAAGTFMLQMRFIPHLPLQAVLNLENLGRGSSVLKAPGPSTGTSQGDKQTRNVMGGSDTAVYIGSFKYTQKATMLVKNFSHIGISVDDFIKKVRRLYRNYAKSWGADNLLMIFGEEFKKACQNRLLKTPETGFGGSFSEIVEFFGVQVPASLQDARVFLAEFGIALKVVYPSGDFVNTLNLGGPQDNPLPSISDPLTGFKTSISPLLEAKVFIDIDHKFKKGNKFREVFDTFYKTLTSVSNIPIEPDYLIESNTTVLRYLKKTNMIKQVIENPDSPLVIIGDRTCIKREIYGMKGVGNLMIPLLGEKASRETQESLQQYYVNKTSHSFRSNYFEDVGSIADELSFREAIEWDETDTSNMLTFKANTPDSNILDYNFDLNLETFKEFVKSFSQKPGNKERDFISKSLKSIVPLADLFDIDGLSNDIVKTIGSASFKEVGQRVTITESGYKPAYTQFVKDLHNQALTGRYMSGKIKTVPYFQLSDNIIQGTPCQITINKTPNLDNYPIDPEDTEAFFSGKYIIIGFRHVITPTEVYSEFDVLRVAIKEKSSL